ncbi:MAG TPA: V-type ATP synthase subunit B, partial [Spirochaetia bacterium]|nr:V-type ATP synthase subunit B [Spirochaetia bacterium]
MRGLEHRRVDRIEGPILVLDRRESVGFGEVVKVRGARGEALTGRVIDLSETAVAVQVFGPTQGLSLEQTSVEFTGDTLKLRVGPDLLGRVFNGLGEPVDGSPALFSSRRLDVNGEPLNPWSRVYPRDFIQTGISAIDGMNTLIRGQKLPIFSGNGLPHNKLAAQIVRQAKIRTADEDFVMVFGAMGVKYDVARFFLDSFESSGVLANVVLFLSLADAPSIERLITPRSALTAAEYLAYHEGRHVLVILTDMTNYCESLR